MLRALAPPLALLLLVTAAPATAQDQDDFRRVVLLERHGFARGRAVDINLVEAPGVQKLLAIVCQSPVMAVCQGFALNGRAVLPLLREPSSAQADDVFEAFFGGPHHSKLFGPNAIGKTLKPTFRMAHREDGSYELSYELNGGGVQTSTIRTKPRYQGYDFIFIGVEVNYGVSDPVGSVSTF